jgi:hypothetical protein
MDCQSNGYPSEKDHDLPGIQTRDLQISSQHCLTLHHLGRPFSSSLLQTPILLIQMLYDELYILNSNARAQNK